jgi:hypothetical protein
MSLTGREMVFYLLEKTHLGKVVSFYLNNVESKYYRPYDLITVPSTQKNAEHYVFSVFGVLHIVPGEESERLTLAEWNRHAVLWQACSQIKFFKRFLFLKFMRRWRQNTKLSQFLKLKNSISKNIIICIPYYSNAMIELAKLVQSILDINFLPKDQLDTSKKVNARRANSVYSVESLDETVKLLNKVSEKKLQMEKEAFTLNKFLQKVNELNSSNYLLFDYFFVYVKYILINTREKMYEKFRFHQKLYILSDLM